MQQLTQELMAIYINVITNKLSAIYFIVVICKVDESIWIARRKF